MIITSVTVRKYTQGDIDKMLPIWNEVVLDGNAFPQEETLDGVSGASFFAAQTYAAVAEDSLSGDILGLYILHPNNVGRCSHICNASFAVKKGQRGMGVGEKLVLDCMKQGRAHGFTILQFNAVVASNAGARRLYERLGFIGLGVIKRGFRKSDGTFEDICPYYIPL